jgi:hypothetical protein
MGIEEIVEDWGTVRQRFEAWWQQGVVDRPLIGVTAPRAHLDDKQPLPATPGDLTPGEVEAQWTDIDVMIQRQEKILRRTYFGGEALPVFWHNWSAGHSLYFGCKPHFTPDTVWVDPAPVDAQDYPILEGWEASPWWQWMQDCTLRASRASRGRWFMLPMWGNHAGDNLGLVRGTQQLLLDIATNRAWVRQAIKRLSDIQIKAFERLWELVDPAIVGVEGSINYVSCWSPRRTMAFDCDLSCMFSSQDFRELFLLPLLETMHTVEQRIYHLDGVVALQHLPTLLSLPELHAIQWVPGAGREAIAQWIPLIQRVQAAGKSIAVYVQPEEIPLLLKECRPEGLFINTSCPSEDAARRVIEVVS